MNRNIAKLSYLISLPVLGIVYDLLNHDNGKVFSVITDIDRLIPFVKYFIVPYLLWYPFVGGMLVFFFFQDYRIYKKQLLLINLGAVACFLTYLLFQTTVPRPILSESDFFTNLVGMVYTLDNPYNALPSTHVLSSYCVLLGARELSDRFPLPMRLAQLFSCAIIVSTVFLKQHTILDGIASIAIVNVLKDLVKRDISLVNLLKGYRSAVFNKESL